MPNVIMCPWLSENGYHKVNSQILSVSTLCYSACINSIQIFSAYFHSLKSPYLTPLSPPYPRLSLSLWGYAKDLVFKPPLSKDVYELQDCSYLFFSYVPCKDVYVLQDYIVVQDVDEKTAEFITSILFFLTSYE